MLLAALTATVLLPLWRHLDVRYEQAQRSEYRSQIREHASSYAAGIAASVNRRLTLIDGLYAFVQSQLSSPRFESDLKSFSAGLYAAAPGIRAVEVIPGGVIRFVYPLKGNEAALGHDLNADSRLEVRTGLDRARLTGQNSLTGPLELRQGGLGLVARRAMFRDGRFWGFVTIIVDVQSVIRETTVGPRRISFALRDRQGRVFWGDPAIFGSDPVLERVPLPDGFWEVAALPAGGWASLPNQPAVLVYRALALSLVLAICMVVYLITERQYRLSREVRAGQEQYRLVTESVPLLLSSFDNLCRCRFANKAHESWFGRPRSEWIGKDIGEMLGEEVSRKIHESLSRTACGDLVSFDAEIPVSNGGTRYAHAACVIQFGDDSAPDGFYLVATDITELKQAEAEREKLSAQLAQAQKMESVGRLAGGIAHDFNNLLTVINGYSQMLLAQFRVDDPLREQLKEIHDAGERAAALTRQLLAFSRKQILQPRALDLNQVLRNMQRMLQRLLGEDVEVRFAPCAEDPWVKADPHQLEQVVMNLAVNSRDAMPNGGRLLIETGFVERDQSYADSHPDARPGRYAALTVSDNGSGMDEETRRQIFEPFFTTKAFRHGTGLGLSIVHGIVAQSGGHISVYSEPDRGTTFQICLPVAAAANSEAEQLTRVSALQGGETILVAEDQAEVLTFVTAVLKAYGYRVIPAASADEALLICERKETRIDLVLTDVIMPQMSGPDLVVRLAKLRPGIKALFMSGYTDNVIVHHGVLDEGTNFIQKPFTPDQLAAKVRNVLEPPTAASASSGTIPPALCT